MNELNTEVNLGVGSKQVSHLCFIKPIGLFAGLARCKLLESTDSIAAGGTAYDELTDHHRHRQQEDEA